MRKVFTLGQNMFLFNSHLHLFLEKLCSQWYGPHGAIEIKDLKNGVTFKVNSQIIKPYLEYQPQEKDTKINLSDSLNLHEVFSF